MSNYLLLSKLLCIAVNPEVKSDRYVYLQEKRRKNFFTRRDRVVVHAGFYERVEKGLSRDIELRPIIISELPEKYYVEDYTILIKPDVALFDVTGERWQYYFSSLESANDFKDRVLLAVKQGAVAVSDKGEIVR